MLEKIKCPQQDSNPRHPNLMKGALTTELPRQPQWSELNISYKGTSISKHLSGLGANEVCLKYALLHTKLMLLENKQGANAI